MTRHTWKVSYKVTAVKMTFPCKQVTLLKYKEDPDETTPQPMSGVTTSPPITSCHVASSASWDSKSESTLEERGDEGWQSVPEKPSSHLQDKEKVDRVRPANLSR